MLSRQQISAKGTDLTDKIFGFGMILGRFDLRDDCGPYHRRVSILPGPSDLFRCGNAEPDSHWQR
jgi:hypothetical protein